jgi:hypothetical protein
MKSKKSSKRQICPTKAEGHLKDLRTRKIVPGNPAEQQPGARFELDATRCDIYIRDESGWRYRPTILATFDRCSGHLVGLAVEKRAEAN